MIRIIAISICTLLLCSCNKHVKTYSPNGKIATEYYIDNKGKKNGPFKVYNKDGQLYRETLMIHDTISGLIFFYYESGQLAKIEHIERGLYPISIADTNFNPEIENFSKVEIQSFNKTNALDLYDYSTKKVNGRCLFIIVKYKNDSISEIFGIPLWGMYKTSHSSKGMIDQVKVIGANIPKCSRNFYLLDSAQEVIDTCINCSEFAIHIDRSKVYSMKVEYIESTFHIRHIIEEPFGPLANKRFPGRLPIVWTRE